MSNAEALSLPVPIEPRALLRVEALPSERHPAAVYLASLGFGSRWPDCDLVFNSGGRSFRAKYGGLPSWAYRLWKEACKGAGTPDLRPYDLRRSAVRNLIRAGVPEVIAMKITGHRSRETFRRYAIFDSEDTAAALRTLGEFIGPQFKGTRGVLPFRKGGQKHGHRG